MQHQVRADGAQPAAGAGAGDQEPRPVWQVGQSLLLTVPEGLRAAQRLLCAAHRRGTESARQGHAQGQNWSIR